MPSGRGCELGRPLGFSAGYDDALTCDGADPEGSLASAWTLTDGGEHDCAEDCGCPAGADCSADCRAAWGQGFERCWLAAYEEGYAAGDAVTDCDDI